MGDKRVTYNRKHCYKTKSNRTVVVKTPGSRLTTKTVKKRVGGPKCGDCKVALPGIKCMRATKMKTAVRHEKSVSRAYGGSRCANCVRQRIVRAFLIEEQKIVKKMLLEKAKKSKK